MRWWSKAGSRRARGPQSRPLAFEAMESRLVLSGPQLDQGIYNLDPIQDSYAVISAGEVEPAPTLNYISSFIQFDTNAFDASVIDADDVFTGAGLFRPGSLVEHRSAINVVGDTLIWSVKHGSPVIAGELPGTGVVRQVIADAASGNLELPLRTSLLSGPYVPLFEENDAGGPRVDLLEAMPTDPLIAGGTTVTESSPSEARPADGGEIALDRILAGVGSGSSLRGPRISQPLADGEVPVAARSVTPAYVSGELARAVAFESMDGQATPIVYAAADGNVDRPVLAAVAAQDAVVQAHAASERIADAALSRPVPLTPVLQPETAWESFAVHLASLPAEGVSEVALAPADAAFAQAFAELDEDREIDSDRLDREEKPHLWLAGVPVLAAVIAERLVKARRKYLQTELHPPRRPAR